MDEEVIRATFDDKTITVYQAYNNTIADQALGAQYFKYPFFKLSRMTWIKPSFLWMMYRSGYASKSNQERILSIDITHDGWIWALENSCSSNFDKNIYKSIAEWENALKKFPVRIQWDPERNLFLEKLNYRTIQVGLKGLAAEKYINDWIVKIKDITPLCLEISTAIKHDRIDYAVNLLPQENIYPYRFRPS